MWLPVSFVCCAFISLLCWLKRDKKRDKNAKANRENYTHSLGNFKVSVLCFLIIIIISAAPMKANEQRASHITGSSMFALMGRQKTLWLKKVLLWKQNGH